MVEDDDIFDVDDIDDEDSPNWNAVETMAVIDKWARGWRDLANEYGFQIVNAFRNDNFSLAQTRAALKVRHEMRQAEWLATDYITPKVRQSFEASH